MSYWLVFFSCYDWLFYGWIEIWERREVYGLLVIGFGFDLWVVLVVLKMFYWLLMVFYKRCVF